LHIRRLIRRLVWTQKNRLGLPTLQITAVVFWCRVKYQGINID
jgi:hypothetical protein